MTGQMNILAEKHNVEPLQHHKSQHHVTLCKPSNSAEGKRTKQNRQGESVNPNL